MSKIKDKFNPDNQEHIKALRQFCISKRLACMTPYRNKWNQLDKGAIEELKLILKCFPDDNFLKTLKKLDMFGENKNHAVVINLPAEAIDIGYEFFLLLKNIDELEKNDTDKTYYTPQRFKDFLSIINPLFKGIQVNDSKDLIICLYETWHNIYNVSNTTEHEKAVANKIPKYGDPEFMSFCKYYFANNGSIISDIFYNVQRNRLHCLNCNFDKVSYNIMNIAVFPLMRVYAQKFKLDQKINDAQRNLTLSGNIIFSNYPQNPQYVQMHQLQRNLHVLQSQMKSQILLNYGTGVPLKTGVSLKELEKKIEAAQKTIDETYANMPGTFMPQHVVYTAQKEISMILTNKSKTVMVEDLFSWYSVPELLTGGNQIYCNNCKHFSNATQTNYIHSLPKQMTMIFNRGKGVELDIDVRHADYIDPWDVLEFNPGNNQCFHWINVRANLLHLGESSMAGHFISAIRSGKDNKPRTYNDDRVNDRNEMEANLNPKDLNLKEMPYVWFTDTMTLHLEIDTILEKVKDDQFRDAICAKFLSLGVLDAQEKNPINKKRQMIFAYLLMYAFEKCMANKNLVQNQFGQVNPAKAQNFDKYLSDFICDAFNMIATWDDFNFDENNCLATTNQIKNWRQNILNCAQNATYVPSSGSPVQFDIHYEQFNNNTIINDNNKNIIIQGNINNQNDIINNNIITNQNGSNKSLYSQNSKYDPYASESPKYNSPSKKSKLAWLKFALAVIFAIATIVLIVLELYLIALISFVFMFLPFVIPKLCESCLRCVYSIDPSYKNERDYNDNYSDNNKKYQQELPISIQPQPEYY